MKACVERSYAADLHVKNTGGLPHTHTHTHSMQCFDPVKEMDTHIHTHSNNKQKVPSGPPPPEKNGDSTVFFSFLVNI